MQGDVEYSAGVYDGVQVRVVGWGGVYYSDLVMGVLNKSDVVQMDL